MEHFLILIGQEQWNYTLCARMKFRVVTTTKIIQSSWLRNHDYRIKPITRDKKVA